MALTELAATWQPFEGVCMKDIATHPLLDGQYLDAAIKHTRAALAALLRAPAGGEFSAGGDSSAGGEGAAGGKTAGYLKMTAELRALLGALLDHRLALATARMDERDPVAVAGVRIDRNEAIAVHAALLYRLPCHDPAWPEVAMTVGRLSYDRYSDSWPGAEPPDPDDLDAACDLFLRAVRQDEADEHTVLYLVLALRDRQRLVACPADAVALMTWGERLLAFPGAGGLGQAGLHDLLELELLDRVKAPASASTLAPHSLHLTSCPT
jgi:hypothetical protein